MSPTKSLVPSGSERRAIVPISSTVLFSNPVRTLAATPEISPAGSASASSPIADAISPNEMSLRTSSRSRTSTTVRGASTPRMVERVTPAPNSRTTNSSAYLLSRFTDTGPVMTTSVTRSRHALRRTSGSSASSGRPDVASTAARTSSVPRFMSHPGSNSSVILALPSLDWDEVDSTPSTASSAGSSSWTIA